MPRPHVHIIATGGTIAATPSGMLTVHDLLAALPDLPTIADITVEQFGNIGSNRITPNDWVQLAASVHAAFQTHPGLHGVVITHGTDTLEETAYFLHLTVAHRHPIVVTGSMRRAHAISADGPANLYQAIRVAACPEAQAYGTVVVMSDEIHAARTVTKTHTLHLHTFASPIVGTIGTVDGEQIHWHHQPSRSHDTAPPFPFVSTQVLPRVDIVYSYAGADDQLIRAVVAAGARGIVVATFGSGRVTEGQERAIRQLLKDGMVVVLSSRVGSGHVEANYENGLAEL